MDILIDAVYRREPIWDPANEFHKHPPQLKLLWQEVAVEVNKDVKICKGKWKRLRSYFIRECTKLKSKNLDIGKGCSPWQYYDQLLFLKSTLPDTTKPNHSQEKYDGDEIIITNLEEIMPYPDTFSPEPSHELSNTSPSRKRKLQTLTCTNECNYDSLLEIERKKLKILESDIARGSNDDLLFFESLLPFMKDIPIDRKLNLRSRIQDLIRSEFIRMQHDAE